MRTKIMLVGLGDLGGVTLQYLAREPQVDSILVATRNLERARECCNLARMSASALGATPEIRSTALDLNHLDEVASTVSKEAPDLILHTATMFTWWLPSVLPPKQAALIKKAGFGAWLPVHLTLSLKLARALQFARYQGHTLIAPFPDVANCVLGRIGLPVTCGVGNLDELVPKLELLAAERLEVDPSRVRVLLVAHHSLESAVLGGRRDDRIPYCVRIEYEGRDVTAEVEADTLLWEHYPIPAGREIHFLTAASTVRLIRALSSETECLVHAPGPQGLPGGYPVHASSAGVRVVEIPGTSLEEAVRINENSHRFDGVRSIEADGTVVFCEESVEILKQELGYDCPSLTPSDSEERAVELIERFWGYAGRYGVGRNDIH